MAYSLQTYPLHFSLSIGRSLRQVGTARLLVYVSGVNGWHSISVQFPRLLKSQRELQERITGAPSGLVLFNNFLHKVRVLLTVMSKGFSRNYIGKFWHMIWHRIYSMPQCWSDAHNSTFAHSSKLDVVYYDIGFCIWKILHGCTAHALMELTCIDYLVMSFVHLCLTRSYAF